jgi:hypothetical protein
MQDTIEVFQKGVSLLDLLKIMPVEHRHSFSKIDLNVVEETLDVFQFYENVLSFDKIPIRFSDFIISETEYSLYHLSNLLDNYKKASLNLKPCEKTSILKNEKRKHIDCTHGSRAIYAYR